MNTSAASDLSELGLWLRLARPVRVNVGRVVTEIIVRPEITWKELEEEVTETCGAAAGSFRFLARIFEFNLREGDEVIVRAAEKGLPLVVRRDGEVIVNFDIRATRAFQFPDSKRPIYTYIPGFHIHMVPEGIRRPLSNLVQSLRVPKCADVPGQYRRLPLTGFEFTLLLLNTISLHGCQDHPGLFQWPSGKRAVFISLHDVDTKGLLRERERDPLFRIDAKHQVRSTWFIPTAILNGDDNATDFLLKAGHDVGWHGHKHDHRDHLKPYADHAVQALLANSRLSDPENFPIGMRLPKLLKSNYLFDLIERSCPTLCYDTSFLHGIAPYYLWLNGNQSTFLEIPTTVPTDIRLYNELLDLRGARRAEIMLKAQIARTQKLIEVGGVISIVTHPEKELSERPDFLDVYDQYLSYVRSCPDIWFTTAGELYKYWMGGNPESGRQARCQSKANEVRTQPGLL